MLYCLVKSQPIKDDEPPAKKPFKYTNFVSASAASTSSSNQPDSTCSTESIQPIKADEPSTKKPFKYTNFVTSSSATSSTSLSNQSRELNSRNIPVQPKPFSTTKLPEFDLIIVKLDYQENENPCNVLSRSAAFSKTSITWEMFPTNDTQYSCNIKLQNNIIHSAKGTSQYSNQTFPLHIKLLNRL